MSNQQQSRFDNEQAAARFLLQESTSILIEHGVDFVVVGGWVPFLFHRARFGHPGTYDVDILLHSRSLDDGSFDSCSESMLSRGYLRAVKNHFQAHRILEVAGERFVFHVDFLNERHPGNSLQLIGGVGKVKSIYTPIMEVVFKYDSYRTVTDPDLVNVRFPSAETFIATKAAAALVKKRRRDAFDVYVTVADQEPKLFAQSWSNLVRADGLFRDANDALWQAVWQLDSLPKIRSVLAELRAPALPSEKTIQEAFGFLTDPSMNPHM